MCGVLSAVTLFPTLYVTYNGPHTIPAAGVNLPFTVSVENPHDPKPREPLALAATLAGAAFSVAGVVVPHAIAQALGGLLHVPHGLGVAVGTPVNLRFNADCCTKQYCELADYCGEQGLGLSLETGQETAEELVHFIQEVARPNIGINFDPANIVIMGIDPVIFVQELGDRIYHAHAKDGEVVEHNVRRSGLQAQGKWDRIDRGFRFRIPGWGDVDWKKVFIALNDIGFDKDVIIEHEDPVFGGDRTEEGLTRGLRFLKGFML